MSFKQSIDAKTAPVKDIASWHPTIDSKVDDLQSSVKIWQSRWSKLLRAKKRSPILHTRSSRLRISTSQSRQPPIWQHPHLRLLQGNLATALLFITGDLAMGSLPPSCHPRSKVPSLSMILLQFRLA